MILELLSTLMMTTWGQVAVFGTSVAVLVVWLLYAIESSLIEEQTPEFDVVTEGAIYTVEEYPDPADRAKALQDGMQAFHDEMTPKYVKAKFVTFETPFAIHKKTEPGYFFAAMKALLTMPGIVLSMVVETINDFKTWSKTNYMFYVGVAGFAGLYYGGMLLLTNPMVQQTDKTVFVIVALMLLAIGYEFINGYKGEENEQQPSVEV